MTADLSHMATGVVLSTGHLQITIEFPVGLDKTSFDKLSGRLPTGTALDEALDNLIGWMQTNHQLTAIVVQDSSRRQLTIDELDDYLRTLVDLGFYIRDVVRIEPRVKIEIVISDKPVPDSPNVTVRLAMVIQQAGLPRLQGLVNLYDGNLTRSAAKMFLGCVLQYGEPVTAEALVEQYFQFNHFAGRGHIRLEVIEDSLH